MAIDTELSIRSMTINQIFSLYKDRKLIVNRQYQRKLCWTIEEKRNFIDTIIKGFPVPLFLFASDGAGNYEIIDGMQRLDAICTFIEQRYSLKDGYFNLRAMPDTLESMDRGLLKQKRSSLPSDICKNIANYPLPVSIFGLNNQDTEEVFSRINSTGKHLSKQELRQVGVNSTFADIVKEISQSIRGDYSDNILKLNEMSNISLSNHKLDYGVEISKTFWIKNDIFPGFGLRQSRDEEVIALIIINMLSSNKDYHFYSNILDKYYGYNKNPLDSDIPIESNQIQVSIDKFGRNNVINQFNIVFSCIENILNFSGKNFRELLSLGNVRISDIGIQFQMVFLTIYRLMILEGKTTYNSMLVAEGIQQTGILVKDKIKKNEISSIFNAIYGNLVAGFEKIEGADPAVDDWTRRVVNIINKSRTEQSLYDFKIGLFNLQNKTYDKNILEKIIKTLTAISNIGKNNIGYVIIGVADTVTDAEFCKKQFGVDYILEGSFPVIGIDHEYNLKNQTADIYIKNIKEHIKNTASIIDDDYKIHLINNMQTPLLFGRQLVLLKTDYNDPVLYNGEYYQREFSDIRKLEKSEYKNLMSKFK